MPSPLLIAFGFLFGLTVGSFCNVCIHRIPRKESIVTPRSHCPHCGLLVRAVDNIPLISFLLLRGQCRSCGHRISWQYPVVEFLTGLLFLLAVFRFGVTWRTGLLLIFLAALVIVTFIDFEHQIVPDVITLPGIVIGLAASLLFRNPPFWNALLGALIGGGIFYLVAVLSQGGMGGGDIKLAAMIGAFLGWKQVLLTIFLGTLAGSVIAIFLLASGKKGRKDPMPFGPFLVLAAILVLFWEKEILAWYWYLLRGNL